MRRFVPVCMCVMMLLTACTKERSVDPVTEGFRCTVNMTYNGAEMEAILDRTDSSKTTLEFQKPTELLGLSMVYENDTLSAYYAGFRVQIDESSVPSANAVKLIDDVLKYVSAFTDGTKSEYEFEDGSVLQVNPHSGLPTKLEISSGDITIVFSNWDHPSIEH